MPEQSTKLEIFNKLKILKYYQDDGHGNKEFVPKTIELETGEVLKYNPVDCSEEADFDAALLFIYQLNFEYCSCANIEAELRTIYRCLKHAMNGDMELYWGEEESKHYGERMFIIKTLDKLELLEHGTSVHFSWLTDKGKDLFHDLDLIFTYG